VNPGEVYPEFIAPSSPPSTRERSCYVCRQRPRGCACIVGRAKQIVALVALGERSPRRDRGVTVRGCGTLIYITIPDGVLVSIRSGSTILQGRFNA